MSPCSPRADHPSDPLPPRIPVLAGGRLRRQGHFRQAEQPLREAVAQAEPAGEGAALGAALNELGLWCKDVGRYTEAREHYLRALRALRSGGRADPDDLATLYHNLAGIEHARGQYGRGEALARRGLALRLSSPRQDAAALAGDLVALAALVSAQSRWSEAERLYLAGLERFRSLAGDWALEIAVALNGLGAQYAEMARMEEAAHLLEQAAALKRRVLGDRHPDLALTLNNLAVTRRRLGDPAGAAGLYVEALRILDQALGPDHPRTAACRANTVALFLPPGPPRAELTALQVITPVPPPEGAADAGLT